jgi:hypothetical protein
MWMSPTSFGDAFQQHPLQMRLLRTVLIGFQHQRLQRHELFESAAIWRCGCSPRRWRRWSTANWRNSMLPTTTTAQAGGR